MNRADTEREAMAIIDTMADEYRIQRREILEALMKPDIQNAIYDRITFERLRDHGNKIPREKTKAIL